MASDNRFACDDLVSVRAPEREFDAAVIRVNKHTLRVRSIDDETEFLVGKALCEPLGVNARVLRWCNMRTPWGMSRRHKTVEPGITFHSTSSHGGFFVAPVLNMSIPKEMQNRDGWYEEDVHWCKVVLAFPQLFAWELCYKALEFLNRDFPDAAAVHGDRLRAEIDNGMHGTQWTPFVAPETSKR